MNLLPVSNQNLASHQRGWHKIPNPRNYISGIETRMADEESNHLDLASMLTAIPTPWSRAYLLKSLLSQTFDEDSRNAVGRVKSALEEELKGLIVAVATDSNLFSIESIELYKKIDTQDNLGNGFDLQHSLSKFISSSDWKFWTELSNEEDQDPEKKLNIDLLYFNDEGERKLVGYIFPRTLFITTEDYDLSIKRNYVDEGKFKMPGANSPIDSQVSAYINLLIERITSSKRPEWNVLLQILRSIPRDQKADNSKEVVFTSKRSSEIAQLLSSQKKFIFHQDGYFQNVDSDKEVEGFYLSDLFLDPSIDFVTEFEDVDTNGFCQLLEVQDDGVTRFFSWPFTRLGLIHLRDSINNDLTRAVELVESQINDNNLTVKFSIELGGGKQYQKAISYNVLPTNIVNKQIIVWPDFISPQWEEGYFLYNEIPSNSLQLDVKVTPIYGDYMLDNQFNRLVLNDSDNQEVLLLRSRNNREVDYEVIRSEKPILGVSFGDKNGQGSGGVLFRKDESLINAGSKKFNVGFDFGSNNTCVCIQRPDEGHGEPIEFNNRRRFFLGKEVHQNDEHPALQHEMMLFTNEHVHTNKIKSFLLEQRLDDIVPQGKDINHRMYTLVYATPVFESNINVQHTDFRNSSISIELSDSPATIRYDLKWKGEDQQVKSKVSYIRTLITMLQAELFAVEGGTINKLAWAFPGVDAPMRRKYEVGVWDKLFPDNEINIQSLTEAEAIYCFMKSRKGNVHDVGKALGIGIDVGGSTSDIVVNREEGGFNQESLFIAAGRIAALTTFEKDFHRSASEFIGRYEDNPVLRTMFLPANSNPYSYNQLLDNLDINEVKSFYTVLQANCPNLFIVNAYITGIIMLHTGMQAGLIARERQHINNLSLHIYGRGGQIFDWIKSQYPGDPYFEECLKYGLMLVLEDGVRVNNFTIEMTSPTTRGRNEDLKIEVAIGLCQYLEDESLINSSEKPANKGTDFAKLNLGTSNSVNAHSTVDHNAILEEMIHISDESASYARTSPMSLSLLTEIGNYNTDNAPQCFDLFIRNVFVPFMRKPNVALLPDASFEGYHKKWNLANFIHTHPIFKRAKGEEDLPITISVLALEAECFLERILLPSLYPNYTN